MSGPQHDDDAAWRSIVENYGDRPRLEDAQPAPLPAYEPDDGVEDTDGTDLDGDGDDGGWTEERFVPPEPPPLPHPPPARLAAWVGVLGTPTFLLLALLAGVTLPSWLGYVLVAAFVGGFGYLVLHMRRGPREPWDDGAQV